MAEVIGRPPRGERAGETPASADSKTRASASQRHLTPRARHFDASARRREDLPRVAPLIRIENRAQLLHHEQILRAEEQRQLGDLLDPDAVFSGDAAAEI